MRKIQMKFNFLNGIYFWRTSQSIAFIKKSKFLLWMLFWRIYLQAFKHLIYRDVSKYIDFMLQQSATIP
jgi:hypothetical protein